MSVRTLRERLQEWTDWDVAEYHLGAALGLWPEWTEDAGWHEFKGVIWSDTPVGNMLHETIQKLVAVGMLESKDDGEYVRATSTPTWTLAWPGEVPPDEVPR